MVKFFKKKPEKCSVCGLEKNIYKKGGAKGINLKYCKECYDSYFEVVKARAMDQISKAVKSGRMIGIKEAKELTNEITKEIEAEQAQKVIDETQEIYKCPICNFIFKTKEELGNHMILEHSAPKEMIVPKTDEEIKKDMIEKIGDLNGKNGTN